ncbi:MAG: CDP-alcohol phosphatidyltransferase family protein [Candidatus Uhrbacteria bacterium]
MDESRLPVTLPTNFDHGVRLMVDRYLPDWVTPNGITWLRIALVPIIVVCIADGRFRFALTCFLVAIILDVFDGPLARARGKISALGNVLDPIADKVTILIPFWTWWACVQADAWTAYGVIGCGAMLTIIEIGLLAIRLHQIIINIPPSPANLAGKAKVWLEGWMVGVLLLEPYEELTQGFAIGFGVAAIALAAMSAYLHRRLLRPQ